MTNSPIEPHHKDEAAKAADLADALSKLIASAKQTDDDIAYYSGGSKDNPSKRRLVELVIENESVIVDALANDEAKGKALAEIEKLTTRCSSVHLNCIVEKIAAIAAPYRASDPVAEALPKLLDKMGFNPEGRGAEYSLALAALKRGMELARSVEGNQR